MSKKRNLHSIDITVRLIVGVALVYICFIDVEYIGNDVVRWLLGVYGVINIVSAVLRSCPIYALAGISTFRQ